ncbi:MAG: hypothetical protein R2788_21070 [Saprospiraceae bacterium]
MATACSNTHRTKKRFSGQVEAKLVKSGAFGSTHQAMMSVWAATVDPNMMQV